MGTRQVIVPKGHWAERRARIRFPLTLEVRYSDSHLRPRVEAGSGKIIDLSSSGLRFTAQAPLKHGMKLYVAIQWPVLLADRVPLQLLATGVVVWSNGTETALRIQRHDFKTNSLAVSGTNAFGSVICHSTAEAITLTPHERAELEQITQSRTLPKGNVFRARLLMLADGLPYRTIQERLDTTAPTVARRRHVKEGIAGPLEIRHSGQKPTVITPILQQRSWRQVGGSRSMGQRIGRGASWPSI